MKKITALLILTLVSLILAACGGAAKTGPGAAAEKYFQAIADGDENRIVTVSCADWESGARGDVAAFVGVTARLDKVSCQPVAGSDSSSDSTVVECSGAIIATYNNEDSNFELKGKQLKVVKQGSDWLVCGYAQ
jgi:hypothetical protein